MALLQGTTKLYNSSLADHSALAVGITDLQRVPGGPIGLEVTAGPLPTTTPHVGPATTIARPVPPSAARPARGSTTDPQWGLSPVERRAIADRVTAAVRAAATTQNAADTSLMGRRATPAQDRVTVPPATQFSIVLMCLCRGCMAAGPPSAALWVVITILSFTTGLAMDILQPAEVAWTHVPRPGPGLWIPWRTKWAALRSSSHRLCSTTFTTTATDITTMRRRSTARVL